MPVADPAPRRTSGERLRLARERVLAAQLLKQMKRLGKRRDGEAGEGVPVDPTRPGSLSGGAAAALEFDD